MRFSRNIYLQAIAIFPVNMLYVAGGIGCGWLAPILQRYKNSDTDFSLTTEACSVIASIHYVGRAISSVLTAALVNRVGRNKMLIFGGSCGCVVWLAVLLTKSVPLHYALRILYGVGIGSSEITAPLYIGENSSPTCRGIFSGLCSFSFYLGVLIAYVIGTYYSYETIAVVQLAILISILSSTTLLREPAHYLLATGRHGEAEKRFFELRGQTDAARKEFEQTKEQQASLAETDAERVFSVRRLTDKSMRAVCMVSCFLYMTGYPSINAMSSLIFSSAQNLTPNELTSLLGVIQLVSVFFSSSVVERFGRRTLLLISAVLCMLVHLCIAALYYCQEIGSPVPHSAWLLFAFVTTYSVLGASIMFPLMTTIRGELLPPQLKPLGGCLGIVFNSIISVAWTALFLPVAERYGMKANFLWYAAMSLVAMVYVYFDLPETKGLTLTEIQMALKK